MHIVKEYAEWWVLLVIFRITCHSKSKFRRCTIGEKLTNGGLCMHLAHT